MSTNTIPIQQNRGVELRRALDRWHDASQEWVEATMEVAFQLWSAREICGRDDRAFGKWLTENGCDISPDDRSALINMAEHGKISRVALATTARRSVQHIWRTEIKPKVHPPEPDGDDDDLSSDDERCGDRPKPQPEPVLPPEFLTISEEERALAQADAVRRQEAQMAAFRADQEARRLQEEERAAAEPDRYDVLINAWNECTSEEQARFRLYINQ